MPSGYLNVSPITALNFPHESGKFKEIKHDIFSVCDMESMDEVAEAAFMRELSCTAENPYDGGRP